MATSNIAPLDKQISVGTGGPSNSNNPVYLGKDNREPGADLTLDEAAIYNRALSPGEIAQHDYVGRGGTGPMSVSLSTDVLGPGTFNDGYNNNAGDSTVELIRRIENRANDPPYVEAYTQNPTETIDFSSWVVKGNYGGNWGSDTHGRGFNLYLPGDGESNEPHVGFGAHAAMFITFDLDDIRAEHFYSLTDPLLLTGRVGTNGNVPSNSYEMEGGVWLDGVLLETSGLQSRPNASHAFSILLPAGRYLTLAALNGDGSTTYDDATFRDMTLTMVPEPTSACLLGLGALGLLVFARRRRR